MTATKTLLVSLVLSLAWTGCAEHPPPSRSKRTFLDITPPYPPNRRQVSRSDSIPFALIVDAGHGGPNTGTRFTEDSTDLCEDEIAYDIVERLLGRVDLYNHTASIDQPLLRVVTTVHHRETEKDEAALRCDDGSRERFSYPGGKLVTMRPAEGDGLSQRAQVIGAWYETLLQKGYKKSRIALLSIHVNSTNPQYQGVFMLYPGFVYAKLREEEKVPSNLPWGSMVFGTHLMYGLQQTGVVLHTYTPEDDAPVYTYLFQGYYAYFNDKMGFYEPGRLAIFRDTPRMPKILIETANIRHSSDRERIIEKDYRQKIAAGLLSGLLTYANLPPLR